MRLKPSHYRYWMLGLLALFCVAATPASSPEARTQLEAAIQKHGGAAYRALLTKGYHYEADLTGEQGGRTQAKLVRHRKDDRTRTLNEYRGDKETIVFNIDTGWRKQDYLSTKLAVEEIEQQRERLMQEFFAIPRLLEVAAVQGKEEMTLPDGRKGSKVICLLPETYQASKERRTIGVVINAEDQIIGLEYTYRDPELDKDIKTVEMFHAVRQQDNLLIPFEIRRYAGGENAGTTFITKFTLGGDLPDELFTKPVSEESPISRDNLPHTTPFEFSGHLYVQIKINNSKPYWIIVDTGAFNTIIDAKVAKELGLEKLPKTEHALVSLYGVIPAHASEVKSLKIGEAEVKNLTVSVSPIVDFMLKEAVNGEMVIGLLGRDAIAAFQFTVDFPNRKITLDAPDAPAPTGKIMPFDLYGNHIMVTAKVGTKDARLVVDTGAPDNLMPPAFDMDSSLGRTMNLGEWFKRIGEHLPKDTSGFDTKDMLIHRIDRMQIGEMVFEPVFARQKKPEFAEKGTLSETQVTQGLLGVTIMRNYKVTFNYYREQMIWQTLSESERQSYNGGYGVWWQKKNGGLFVEWVMPLSDADIAGVKKGDKIIALDGASPANLSETDLVNRLSYTKPGKPLKLTVERSGKRLDFNLIARAYEI